MLNAVGSIASVLGVALSVAILFVAKSARRAATDAKEAVRRSSAAEEFRNLNRLAGEFLSHVESNQVDAACVRARDLMSAMSISARRWGRFLPDHGRKELDEAYAQLSVISGSLSANGPPASPQQKEKLLRICHGLVKVVGTQAGTLCSEVEEPEET